MDALVSAGTVVGVMVVVVVDGVGVGVGVAFERFERYVVACALDSNFISTLRVDGEGGKLLDFGDARVTGSIIFPTGSMAVVD